MDGSGDHQWVASLGDGESRAPLVRRPTTTDHRHQDQGGGARGEVRRAKAQEAPSSTAKTLPVVRQGARRGPAASLAEPRGGQDRVLPHSVEQIIETFVLVQMLDLDAPVPQTVDQLADILKFFDTFLPAVPEQVIEVPKILEDNIPQRTVLCEPQLAEQLVEVPTVVSHSSLQLQFAEQNVDIPVPGARLRLRGDLPGFSPEQGSTALLDAPQEQFQGFFLPLFPGPKKSARVARQSSAELGAHSSSSTLSAHQVARGGDALQGSVPGQSSAALLGGASRRSPWTELNTWLSDAAAVGRCKTLGRSSGRSVPAGTSSKELPTGSSVHLCAL